MDKPVSFETIIVTVIVLTLISLSLYLGLKSLIIKDDNDNIKRSS